MCASHVCVCCEYVCVVQVTGLSIRGLAPPEGAMSMFSDKRSADPCAEQNHNLNFAKPSSRLHLVLEEGPFASLALSYQCLCRLPLSVPCCVTDLL
eukprot:COSAG06_NODE_496_length_15043_cov_8.883565_4_plen_96_part_00